jgi:POT family proton-dependent oligopeptide transporter
MIICVFWNISFIILSRPKIALWFFSVMLIFATVYVSQIYLKEKGSFRKELTALLLLCLISVFFWAFYFQMFLSLTLFITRSVKPTLLGFNFPAPYYVAVESFGLLVFGYLFAKYQPKRKNKSIAESTVWKFTLSMFLMFIAYLLICLAMATTTLHQLVPPWLILCAYIVIAMSELLLSPVGLSAVTEISKPKYVSTLTGVFFISLGLGGYLSGLLANITSLSSSEQYMLSSLQLNYQHAFLNMLSLLGGAVMLSFVIALYIRFMYRGKISA